ncbi:MAG: ABC-F family ATP-binding cassette domain-containing protein [Ruminococcaceae bacterium]|nr:ABC-F family ATP-binding cassette domain-containing protein [Oscillospiraceae bacterium]
MLLTAKNIQKNYGLRQLVDDANIYLEPRDKIGILGINGTGKSTLLRILAGVEEPDSGTVTRGNNARLSFLQQNPPMNPENNILQQVFDNLSDEYRQLKEYEAKTILSKLGFDDTTLKIGNLSGGQKKRVALAAVLVAPAEILILDEPTNHLDTNMINWLEDYLKHFTGGLIMVTHDRYFLTRVVNRITELERGKFYSYEANYAKYLELKSQRAEMEQASFRKRQAFLRKEYEWISRGVRARGTKSRDRIERYENLKSMDAPETDGRVEITAATSRLGRKIIELDSVCKSFDSNTVLSPFSYGLLKTDRIGIVGRNGIGKSTLLNIISGVLPPDEGRVNMGVTVKIGYFTQENKNLPENEKVIDYINDIAREITTPEGNFTAARMLERFLFTGEMQHSLIGRLSGGEKRRLYLLGILMSAPNVLLLDEPTNDLDIETLGILEEYLEGFPGPIIAVSHDRYFLDKIATEIFEVGENGKISQFTGNYTDYISKKKELEPSVNGDKPVTPKGSRPERVKKLKFSYKEEREFETINEEVATLESQLEEYDGKIAAAGSDYVLLNNLLAEKKDLECKLDEKMERWLYLNELWEKIQAENN